MATEYAWLPPLQARLRGYVARRRYRSRIRTEFDETFGHLDGGTIDKSTALPAKEVALRRATALFKHMILRDDTTRLVCLARYLVCAIEDESREHGYSYLFLMKQHLPVAVRLLSAIVSRIPGIFAEIRDERVSCVRAMTALSHLMVVASNSRMWGAVRKLPATAPALATISAKMTVQLDDERDFLVFADTVQWNCKRGKPILSAEVLCTLVSHLLRASKSGEDSTDRFVRRVLTAPALVERMSQSSLLCDLALAGVGESALAAVERWIAANSTLPHLDALCLLGNLVQLSQKQLEMMASTERWCSVSVWLLERATLHEEQTGSNKRTTVTSHWHPLFGKCSQSLTAEMEGALFAVSMQMRALWMPSFAGRLFQAMPDPGVGNERSKQTTVTPPIILEPAKSNNPLGKWFRRLLSDDGSDPSPAPAPSSTIVLACLPLDDIPPNNASLVIAHLYRLCVHSFPPLRTSILAGLTSDISIVCRLWSFLSGGRNLPGWTPSSVVAAIARWETVSKQAGVSPLVLFLDVLGLLIEVVDEEELLALNARLQPDGLAAVARLLNRSLTVAVWGRIADDTTASSNELFAVCARLTSLLATRDSRCSFTVDENFWLAHDVKPSSLVYELEKSTSRATLLVNLAPHQLALKHRILLFRKFVQAAKDEVTHTSGHLITISRSRLLEDGFAQLANLPPRVLRSTIRVKFVNEQGLDEAGIDQDGVFKEFLELTLQTIVNPELGIFEASASGLLVPAVASSLHEHHLELFNFVGRMMAKAVFEGIVVDAHLSPALLAAALGGHTHRLCAFDELAAIDRDLYTNLSRVKKYAGDVSDLSLTFSYDRNVLGRVETIDLVPGGRHLEVTNANRVDYVHRMAEARVWGDTREQCKAFVAGFQAILSPHWMRLFAPHELQYLISGSDGDVDVSDLRKNSQYFGGFHAGHRVVRWLWHVLEHDFTAAERRLFLKFVTSCSRGPLLGFAYLEPPFSIRCVDVTEDQDSGDTLGSVVRGLLSVRVGGRGATPDRLPTASTCFNLLKLPCYPSKSVLRDKLRYAINSHTGFELS